MSSLNFVRPTPMTDTLYEYALSFGLREPDHFRALRSETSHFTNREMQIAPEQGPFLAMLVRLLGAKYCVEVGAFTGYSSLWIAGALPPEGKLISCDISEEYTAVARKYWKLTGLDAKIELRLAPAADTLDALLAGGAAGRVDFAFIDADKANYDAYYERCLKLLRAGGLIAIDNTLWDGKVADPQVNDPDTVAIRALNKKLYADERVSLSLLPFADGLTLAMKR